MTEREANLDERFGALRSGGFRGTKLSASTELDTKNKASLKHRARFFAKRLLWLVFLSVKILVGLKF